MMKVLNCMNLKKEKTIFLQLINKTKGGDEYFIGIELASSRKTNIFKYSKKQLLQLFIFSPNI